MLVVCLGLGYKGGLPIFATEAMGGIMAWCRRCSNDEGLGGKGGYGGFSRYQGW